MSTEKFTFRDFFVFFLSGISVIFCILITQYDFIKLEVSKPEYNNLMMFVKENPAFIGLLSIPFVYLLGHLVHGIDDLINYWTKLIRGKNKGVPKNKFYSLLNFIAFENRVNGHLERKSEDVEEFWKHCAYLQVNNQFQSADYWYVMNELFKGVTLTCFSFGIYALIEGGKNVVWMLILSFVFWERAHYFAKRFYFSVTKNYEASNSKI